jgi:hypothetical protein
MLTIPVVRLCVLSDPAIRSAMPPPAEEAEETEHIPAPRAPETDAGPKKEADKLTEREQQILVFESRWWKHAGSKEQAIRDTFGLSSTRYYQLLNGLLDNPAALERDPVLVGRLRRLRSTRARTRRR